MPILQVFLILVVVGVVLWAVTTYVPMNDSIRKIIIALAIVLVVFWLLSLFGLFDSLNGFYVGGHHDSGPVHHR